MPAKKNPSLKNPDVYEALRQDGASAEKAARISNAAAQPGRSRSSVAAQGGASGSYDDWTVPQLRKRAKELGLSHYSGKKKAELVTMLREH
ncbi:MAG: Rho termination factor [Aeromicrobium sp.]|nr:Rho termination factor [Aeromicrobium sp.]